MNTLEKLRAENARLKKALATKELVEKRLRLSWKEEVGTHLLAQFTIDRLKELIDSVEDRAVRIQNDIRAVKAILHNNKEKT